jgi:YHS domain-containing protein
MKFVELVCSLCNTEFIKKKKYHAQALKNGQSDFFCSRKCQNAAKVTSEEHQCATCSKIVIRTKSGFKQSKSGRVYCSRTCATIKNNTYKTGENHPNWSGGSYRKLIEIKECYQCGDIRTYLLVVHHKDKDRSNNAIDNLEVLCQNCHVTRHLKLLDGKIVVDWDILTSKEVIDLIS